MPLGGSERTKDLTSSKFRPGWLSLGVLVTTKALHKIAVPLVAVLLVGVKRKNQYMEIALPWGLFASGL